LRVVVAVLLPVALLVGAYKLLRPRNSCSPEPAWRIKCASNLKQIGLSLQIYAGEHSGQYPASFQELLPAADITTEVFVCPLSTDTRAFGPTTLETLQVFGEPGHNSYVYAGAGLTSATITPSHVLAYENLSNHGGDGMNVVYGDGSVEWVPKKQAAAVVAELQAGFNPPRPAATQPSGR
jgi:prepilin-type processing-associated H-X9-DG protein